MFSLFFFVSEKKKVCDDVMPLVTDYWFAECRYMRNLGLAHAVARFCLHDTLVSKSQNQSYRIPKDLSIQFGRVQYIYIYLWLLFSHVQVGV